MWCKKSLGVEIVREKFKSSAISKRQFRKNRIPFAFYHSLIFFFSPRSTRPSSSRQDSARRRIDLRSARESRAGNVSSVLSSLSAGAIHTPHPFVVLARCLSCQGGSPMKKAGLTTPILVSPSAKRYDHGIHNFRIWATT